MERIVIFEPAYDRRDNHFHGVELQMVLKGKAGAVQFLLYTNWFLPETETLTLPDILRKPMPADLGYHSRVPQYDEQPAREDCPYLDGAPCYYDGSTLNAERIYDVLLREGSDGVWRELENYYKAVFGPEGGDA